MLKIITQDKKYRHNTHCGPDALSALLGISTGQAAYDLRRLNNLKAVRSTSLKQMRKVLSEYGYSSTNMTPYPKKVYDPKDEKYGFMTIRWSLFEFMNKCKKSNGDDTYLIGARGHWIVIKADKVICGQMKTERSINARDESDKSYENVAFENNLRATINNGRSGVYRVKYRGRKQND